MGLEGQNSNGTWTRLSSTSTPSLVASTRFSQTNKNTIPYTKYRIYVALSSFAQVFFTLNDGKFYNNGVLIPVSSFSQMGTTGYNIRWVDYSDAAGTLNIRVYNMDANEIAGLFATSGNLASWGSNANTGLFCTIEITKVS